MVSWLVNHSGLVGDVYEIQIGRAENHTIIYSVSTAVYICCCLEYVVAFQWLSSIDNSTFDCIYYADKLLFFPCF